MYDMGVDAYRFSISWSRIFPNGSGAVNQAGVDYYNNLINTLVASGIIPVVTLNHFDLPQALEDSYGGWLSPRIIEEYGNFAEVCFAAFGDRVKYWITFNEPHGFVISGYDLGQGPPARCSVHLQNTTCSVGNSSTEPYIAAHNILLSHAAAATTYKAKFQEKQGGEIGITLDMFWIEPMSNSTHDSQIAQVAQDFQLGWFLDPIYFGDYPSSMREKVKERLPVFSKNESEALKGSLDFLGINQYTAYYAWDISNNTMVKKVLNGDTFVDAGVVPFPSNTNGVPISKDKGASEWFYVVPWGIRKAVNYIKDRYGNPQVIITENGIDERNGPYNSSEEALHDQKRINYHKSYLTNLLAAIKEDGCNVTGYFVWSLLDNWEWDSGFTLRFGLHFVDYKSPGLPRYAKKSADWFQQFLLPY
ncbi:hypothetical protein H6P81_010166 [Aristolochia fimbriata]|uniref:Beta-glucosidase n=1 Tax=Aristolochia fimbriata TaxID=158543 RepID=A0AAV7EP64_ARIFI|nr:hypothetical protein H6P81_010166 [Aristolochia fimbriata]